MVSTEAGTARGRTIKSGQFSLLQRGQHPRDFQLKGKEGRKREENKEHHAWRFVPVMTTRGGSCLLCQQLWGWAGGAPQIWGQPELPSEPLLWKPKQGSVSEGLALQAWGPGFEPWNLHKVSVVAHSGEAQYSYSGRGGGDRRISPHWRSVSMATHSAEATRGPALWWEEITPPENCGMDRPQTSCHSCACVSMHTQQINANFQRPKPN